MIVKSSRTFAWPSFDALVQVAGGALYRGEPPAERAQPLHLLPPHPPPHHRPAPRHRDVGHHHVLCSHLLYTRLQIFSGSESYPVFIATFQDYFVLLGFLSTSFLSCTIFTAIRGPDFSRSQIPNLKLLKKWYWRKSKQKPIQILSLCHMWSKSFNYVYTECRSQDKST